MNVFSYPFFRPILIQAETLKRILGPATVPLQPLAEANANEWVDQFLANLGPFLIRNNLDPFPIMDIDEEFGFVSKYFSAWGGGTDKSGYK